jgi:flagellar hook-associated protein 2
MAIERQPLLRMGQKEAKIQAEISAYGSMKSVLSSLQDSIEKLSDPDTFQATKATTSDDSVLQVTSDTEAVSSSYSVQVTRLAQQHKLGSTEYADTTTFGGNAGDALTLTVGANSFTLDLSTAMTLAEMQAAINVETNETGITAGLITGDSGNQTLVLTSGDTGYDAHIQPSFAGSLDATTFGFSMLNRDADNQPLLSENELDAAMLVDGVTVTRGSNSISDVVQGLTFELVGTGQASVVVGQDSSVARQAVEGFIGAYNKVKEELSSLAASGVNGSVIRGLESQLRGVLNTGASNLGAYAYISELGVTTNADTGKLELDAERLMTAMEENPASLVDFFTHESDGFAAKMDGLLENMLTSGGTLDRIIAGANDRVDSIERSREAMERRLDTIEQRYLKQFGALDTLMASMTTTSDYLSSQLDMLSKMVSREDK